MDFSNQSQPHAAGRRAMWPWVVLLIILVGLGVAVWHYRAASQGEPVNTTAWQAVFLSNGQVYFGHITQQTKTTVVLTNIYYLQGSSALQAGDQVKAPELSLVKLGNELHGPTDEMRISRQQVLFTETLKDDSKVVQAISQYKGK